MSAFSIIDFRGKMAAHSLARANRFEVIIIPPNPLSYFGREISIMAESVVFPSMSISAKAFKTHGPNHQLPVGSDYSGDGIPISFWMDGRMENKRFFDSWLELIVRGNDYLINYQKDYTTSIYISQLNEMNQVIYTIELIDAFPRSFSPIQLDNNASNQIERLNSIISFRRWREAA